MAEILEFKPNPFNGAVIDRSALPVDPDEFDSRLAASMRQWTADGFLTVWLDIPKSQSAPSRHPCDCRRLPRERRGYPSPDSTRWRA